MKLNKVKFPSLASMACASISAILMIIGFSTNYWVAADLKVSGTFIGSLNYGLFAGSLTGNTSTDTFYLTCIMGANACGFSCQPTKEARKDELQRILDGYPQVLFPCGSSSEIPGLHTYTTTTTTTTRVEEFLNAGLWTFLITWLSVIIFFLGGSAVFHFIQVVRGSESDPVIGRVYSLCCAGTILMMICWGVNYGVFVSQNVAIPITLTGIADAETTMGASFYLVIAGIVAQLASITLY